MSRETRVTRLHILPEGEPTFSEMATIVEIEDEAGGEFIAIRQQIDAAEPGKVLIDREELPAIREAIDRLVADLRGAP